MNSPVMDAVKTAIDHFAEENKMEGVRSIIRKLIEHFDLNDQPPNGGYRIVPEDLRDFLDVMQECHQYQVEVKP